MRNLLVAATMLLACSACAVLDEHVDVAYASDPAVPRTAVLRPGDVRLDVADHRRAETPDWIADKKNGYGMRMANVLAQKPVTDLVRDALAQELTARGFRVGTSGPVASLELSRLEAVYQNRLFVMGAIGYADVAVQVRRPDGSIAYARTFSAEDPGDNSIAGTAGMARRSMERILAKVVGQIVSDPAFIEALSGQPRLS